MSLTLKLIKLIGAILLLLTIALSVTCVSGMIGQEDSIYIENAELDNPQFLEYLSEALTQTPDKDQLLRQEFPTIAAHRLKTGEGAILAFRSYKTGTPAEDDDSYQKITVWVNQLISAPTTEFDLANPAEIQALISKGGSAFPDLSCAGKLNQGKVTVVKHRITQDKWIYRVSIDGEFTPTGTRLIPDYCERDHIQFSFDAQELAIADLTPLARQSL